MAVKPSMASQLKVKVRVLTKSPMVSPTTVTSPFTNVPNSLYSSQAALAWLPSPRILQAHTLTLRPLHSLCLDVCTPNFLIGFKSLLNWTFLQRPNQISYLKLQLTSCFLCYFQSSWPGLITYNFSFPLHLSSPGIWYNPLIFKIVLNFIFIFF